MMMSSTTTTTTDDYIDNADDHRRRRHRDTSPGPSSWCSPRSASRICCPRRCGREGANCAIAINQTDNSSLFEIRLGCPPRTQPTVQRRQRSSPRTCRVKSSCQTTVIAILKIVPAQGLDLDQTSSPHNTPLLRSDQLHALRHLCNRVPIRDHDGEPSQGATGRQKMSSTRFVGIEVLGAGSAFVRRSGRASWSMSSPDSRPALADLNSARANYPGGTHADEPSIIPRPRGKSSRMPHRRKYRDHLGDRNGADDSHAAGRLGRHHSSTTALSGTTTAPKNIMQPTINQR